MARRTSARDTAGSGVGRELVVLAGGPWARHWYWRDDLQAMQAASHYVGHPDTHPDTQLRRYRPTQQQQQHPHNTGAVRSRATMWDVPRFAEHHRYRAVIVENVVVGWVVRRERRIRRRLADVDGTTFWPAPPAGVGGAPVPRVGPGVKTPAPPATTTTNTNTSTSTSTADMSVHRAARAATSTGGAA